MIELSKSTVRMSLAGITAGACIAAGALIGTGQGHAVSVDEYSSVRQVLCSDAGLSVDVSYTNFYGNQVDRENVTIRRDGDDSGRSCGYVDLTAGKYGEGIYTSVVASDGGYVYCAVYENGVKVAESEDNSSYYSLASCY